MTWLSTVTWKECSRSITLISRSYLHIYLSGLREEEEEEKNLNIKIDCSVMQINHSIKITVLWDVKVRSLENKYLCFRTTCCLHHQDDKTCSYSELSQGETRSPLVQHEEYNRSVIQCPFVERRVRAETKKSSVAH